MAEKSTSQQKGLKRKFVSLAKTWKSDRGPIISIEKISMHPAYQSIMAMGPDVIPYLLAELEREPDHWFWALRFLTGANPVPRESEGRIKEMASAWIAWGKNQGYTWQ